MIRSLLLSSFFSLGALAQAVTGAGYTPPASVPVAPGQIVTFYASNIGQSIFDVTRAPAGTLPTTLAGITAKIRQGDNVFSAPIIEVRPVSPCPTILTAQAGYASAGINICASLVGVTIQIPYEIVVACPLCARPLSSVPLLLVLSDGKAQSAMELNPLTDQVHILTLCDMFLNTSQPPPPTSTGLPCAPVVTHADGTYVSGPHPAKVGETLTAWALGLGATNPPTQTGVPSTVAVPLAETFTVDYNYRVNALATRPFAPTLPLQKPAYVGLVPGYPGLYQINFTVPSEPPNGTSRCPSILPPAGQTSSVQSNLTVSFAGSTSFDGAGICVDTRIPVD